MKKLIAVLLSLMLFVSPFAFGEEEDLEAKYSKLANETLRTLCRVGSEELNKWGSGNYVKRDSPAWNILIRYDSGWFGKLGRTELNDAGSGNILNFTDFFFQENTPAYHGK